MPSRTETKFNKIFNRLTNLPALPEVASKVLQLSEEEASPAKLAGIIETDAGITAKVLKLVNSAFYSLRSPVSNLSHACGLIGPRTVKSLVLSVSAMSVFKRRCKGFDQTLFWRNSLATAMAARRIAAHVKLGGPDVLEEAYISGLLHAGGVPLYVQFFPDDYAGLLARWSEGGEDILDLEREEFGAAHPEAGWQIVKHWRFPERVGLVIRYHREDPADVPPDLDECLVRLIDVVRLADFWTRRCGVPFSERDAVDPDAPAPIAAWMEIDEDGLLEHVGDVNELVAGLEAVIQAD